ncbi:MAG: 16S rRNA (uracil(1498)-N(3))-methyltransferase [Armatimonadetes bacterium]|nr:16S rRNA (uracil(1498)-N(3))-methyltransferase [Armatimonadota bacterium]
MHRFYFENPVGRQEALSLAGEQAHQITQVLRLKTGDSLCLFDGTGEEFICRIEAGDRGKVAVRVSERLRPPVEAAIRLTLAQGLLKGEKNEWVIQKATELGVAAIRFLTTERTVADLPQGRTASRLARWRKVAVEAAEQSGRVAVPAVLAPAALSELWRQRADYDLALMPWEREEGNALTRSLARFPEARRILCVIGPEGGFSEAEISEGRRAGAEIVTLGPRVLRAETAALAATALILQEVV